GPIYRAHFGQPRMFDSSEPPPRRKTLRLPSFDYGTPGAYFVTLCVRDRKCVLARMDGDTTILNGIGTIVAEEWQAIPAHYPTVRPDEFVVMPNHLHGILWLEADQEEGTINRPLLQEVIRAFKARTTLHIHREADPHFAYQRNYHEHVIRDDEDLYNIRKYIQENPLKWTLDKENPDNP
ncbi:hypothetical protein KKH27_08345, partial [bacterium]|nr:hypothetical protein [bacterium]